MNKTGFEYRLKESPRGRNIRLRVTLSRGLEVYVPRGYDTSKLPDLLEKRKNWITTALERRKAQRKFFEPEPAWCLPHTISLPAIGIVWHIDLKETHTEHVALREISKHRLVAFGNVNNESAGRRALARWLTRQTREHLVPRVRELSLRTGLKYKRIFVRKQRTRWASCSRRKIISLNSKLLFLRPDLIDYVILHELCHLAEMNHSKRFWSLLKSHSPNYLRLDSELREMWKVVPRWAYDIPSKRR